MFPFMRIIYPTAFVRTFFCRIKLLLMLVFLFFDDFCTDKKSDRKGVCQQILTIQIAKNTSYNKVYKRYIMAISLILFLIPRNRTLWVTVWSIFVEHVYMKRHQNSI